MEEKNKLIPLIALDSTEFVEKVLFSINEADGVSTYIDGDIEDKRKMNNLLFLLMNTRPSQRKHCWACNGYHYSFRKDFEPEEEKDKGCLCSQCAGIMAILHVLGTKKEKIVEYIKSRGEINPFELMKDGIEKMVAEGKIKLEEKPLEKK